MTKKYAILTFDLECHPVTARSVAAALWLFTETTPYTSDQILSIESMVQ